MEKPAITPVEDGPLCVTAASGDADARLLRDAHGDVVDEAAPLLLCRCGGSSDKPFCDGTHATNGFSSVNTCDHAKDRRDDYVGAGITVHNNPQLCSVSRRCVEGLPQVFRRGRQPWCDPDAAPVADIIALVETCPSGALWYSVDGEEHRDFGQASAVTVMKDGPYAVTGGVVVEAPDAGVDCSKEHCALCRCGASANKPYCDGSHVEAGFTDPEE